MEAIKIFRIRETTYKSGRRDYVIEYNYTHKPGHVPDRGWSLHRNGRSDTETYSSIEEARSAKKRLQHQYMDNTIEETRVVE